MKNEQLLKVEDLTIGFSKEGRLNPVVDHISFEVGMGEILGIVGESGSGKSMTALAVMGLLPEEALMMSGNIYFNNIDLTHASKKELRELKGTKLAMIFQEPMTSFNPVLTIGEQVEEMLKLHDKLPGKQYKEKTIAALLEAGLEDAKDIYAKYPHELSGGMRQRAMIAMAMIAGPKLLIADEPTTALDVTIQARILKLLKKLNETYGTSIILVSHDLGVIKSICDRTLVMKDGQITESGNASDIFENPETEYTKELVAAAPAYWMKNEINRENDKHTGCPGIENINYGKETTIEDDNILHVESLNVYYQQRTGKLFGGRSRKQVVKNVSLDLKKGEVLGIVGESGCGKTTLAKAIAGLIKDTQGIVRLSDKPDHEMCPGDKAKGISRPQMVFQDPYSSLNPARKVGWILEEPLKIRGGFSKGERKTRVMEIIRQVGLEKEHLGRYVSQLSGGQRQRVAIAAALILNPELIILDEPVSALDVTVQSQILELLKILQQKLHLSYLFISHDLNVIYKICDRVCIMYEGEIIESGRTQEIFWNPEKVYTKELLNASLSE